MKNLILPALLALSATIFAQSCKTTTTARTLDDPKGQILAPYDYVMTWGRDTFDTRFLATYFVANGMVPEKAFAIKDRMMKSLWDKHCDGDNLELWDDLLFNTFGIGWDGYIRFWQKHRK